MLRLSSRTAFRRGGTTTSPWSQQLRAGIPLRRSLHFSPPGANPLVIILLVASTISLALGDEIGGLIIISIVLLSVLNFFMEFHARHAVDIRKQVTTKATVIRDRDDQELPIAELVSGTSSG